MKEMLEVLAGAVFLIFTWWAAQKQKSDKSGKKTNWKSWMYSNLDEMAYAVVAALIVGYFREEFIYFLLWLGDEFPNTPVIKVFEDQDKIWNFYYDAEPLILFFAGFFSTSIVKGVIGLKNKFKK